MSSIKQRQSARISFSGYDAAHLYSLALENFCVSPKEGICYLCLQLKKRMEKFIGEKEVRFTKQQIKKYSNQFVVTRRKVGKQR